MIYEASNYMEGIEDHFQVNPLLFIVKKLVRLDYRNNQKYGGGAFPHKIVGGGICPRNSRGGHVPPFPPPLHFKNVKIQAI